MPTPRKFSSYSPYYSQVFRGAINAPYEIICTDRAEAIKTRSHLYAFRSAALLELPDGNEELLLVIAKARTRIEGKTLIIYYDDTDKDLRNAIARTNRADLPVENRQ